MVPRIVIWEKGDDWIKCQEMEVLILSIEIIVYGLV